MSLNPIGGISEDVDVVIASGASLSAGTPLAGYVLCGFYMPATWTAASMTFQASDDGVTFGDIYFGGSELSYDVAGGQYVAVEPSQFMGVRHLKVRSGASGAGVNQGADRSIKLMVGKTG